MSAVILRCVDLETTGMEPPAAEVIEIGVCDVVFYSETKAVEILEPTQRLFGNTRDMPADNIAVHHLTPKMLAGVPPCLPEDLRATAGCYEEPPFAMVAFNAPFEQQFFTPDLIGPMHWICPHKVARRIWPEAPGHSNQVLRYWLGFDDLPEALAMPPHRAAPDAYVTAHILGRMLETESVRDMVRWTLMPKFYATCPLTKHKGKPWSDIDAGFLQWMVGKPNDLDDDIKAAARDELERRRGSGI